MNGAIRLLVAAAASGAIGAAVLRASAPSHDAAGGPAAAPRRIERRVAASGAPSDALRSAPVAAKERIERAVPVEPRAEAPARALSAATPVPLPPSVLHVVDAASGAPLSDLRIALGTPGGATVGGPGWRALEDASASPIALDRLPLLPGRPPRAPADAVSGPLRFWVSAPGRAWTDVSLDLSAGGTSEVALARGADVRIDVRRAPAGHRLRLVPLAGGARVQHERTDLVDGPLELTGVAPGPYEVRVEERRAPHVVARALVVEVPEDGLRVPLDLGGVAARPRQPLRGEIRLAEEWGAPRGRLVVRRAGAVRTVLRTPLADLLQPDGAFVFDAGPVRHGTYEVLLDAYGHRSSVTVDGANGGEPLCLSVPAPATVEVCTAVGAHLRWRPSNGDAPFGRRGVSRGGEGALFLTVPAGRVELEVTSADGSRRATRTLETAPGVQRTELPLPRTGAVEVRLSDAWGAVAWDRQRHRVVAVSRATGERRVAQGPRLGGLEPGDHDLRVEAGGRFVPVELGTVQVLAGRVLPVDARLVPR